MQIIKKTFWLSVPFLTLTNNIEKSNYIKYPLEEAQYKNMNKMITSDKIDPAYHTDTVTSKDGTIINYQITGSGAGIIIVPGALSVAANYNALASELGKSFTVYTIERRGRGLSGAQGENYSIAKECEDVLAIQKKTQASYLFGHSYGGLIALEIAKTNKVFAKIALYEPGVSVDKSISMVWTPAYEKYLAEKKYADAFTVFSIGCGPEKAQKTPHWLMKLMLPLFIKKEERDLMYSLLAQNLNEHKEVAHLDNTYKNYQQVSADVLFMYGGKSGLKWISKATKVLTEVVPSIKVKEFPKLNHFAPDKNAPHEIAKAINDFLYSVDN